MYDSIVEPLQMSNTHTLGYGMAEMTGCIHSYMNAFSKDIVELLYDQIDNLGPAGSMVSCVNDLSHWLMMQLDSGRYEWQTNFTLGSCSAHKRNEYCY